MIFDFFAKRKFKRESLESLEQLLREVVSDGVVTDDEIRKIGAMVQSHDIADEDFSRIREKVFIEVVSQYCADRRVTAHERDSVHQIAARLNVGPAALAKVDADLNYYSLLATIATCPFDEIPHTDGAGIQLQRGEIAYFSHSAQLLEERVVRSQYVGGSRGVSFRLMRGVSYRVGAARGRIQSERAMVPVSNGDFTITNQRLVFTGDRKSVNSPFSKVLNLELFSDGLRFSMTTRQKPVTIQFYIDRSAELAGLVLSRVLNA